MSLGGYMRPGVLDSKNLNINPNYCCAPKPVYCNGVELVPLLCCDRKKVVKAPCNLNINKKCCVEEERVFCNGVEQVVPLCGCQITDKSCGGKKPNSDSHSDRKHKSKSKSRK